MIKNKSVDNKMSNQILLINNYPLEFDTDSIKRLEQIFNDNISEFTLKTVHFADFDLKQAENSIGVILSGSPINVSEFYTIKILRNNLDHS